MSSVDTTTTDASASLLPAGSTGLDYVPLANLSTVHVLSPELVIDAVRTTIQTKQSGIIASLTIPQEVFDSGDAAAELSTFAANLEVIQADARVANVTGSPSLDASGLLTDAIQVTVAYKPTGSKLPPLEVEIEIPFSSVRGTIGLTTGTFHNSPVAAAINDAYNQLVALSRG